MHSLKFLLQQHAGRCSFCKFPHPELCPQPSLCTAHHEHQISCWCCLAMPKPLKDRALPTHIKTQQSLACWHYLEPVVKTISTMLGRHFVLLWTGHAHPASHAPAVPETASAHHAWRAVFQANWHALLLHPPCNRHRYCNKVTFAAMDACSVQALAETLLTLDMPGRICGPEMKPGARVKLSPLGCAMLTTLLSFPQVQPLSLFTACRHAWQCMCCCRCAST